MRKESRGNLFVECGSKNQNVKGRNGPTKSNSTRAIGVKARETLFVKSLSDPDGL
jgi:hypothetical protein